jgi:hypothetical protein
MAPISQAHLTRWGVRSRRYVAAPMFRIMLFCCVAALAAGCADVTVVTKRPTPSVSPSRACVSPQAVVKVGFSKTKYPNIRRHYLAAVREGWPKVLTVHRAGADARRDKLLRPIATRPGMDRDEYPPAVARGSYRADVAYVPSSENRSHGSTMGLKLRRYCDGTRFEYVFY